MPQWIELPEENEELRQRNRDGRSFCLIGNATNDEVTAFCISRFKQYPTAINSLPWGATPAFDFLTGNKLGPQMPLFCMRPDQCKGYTSCPRNPACSE